jgi:hypothetical protein
MIELPACEKVFMTDAISLCNEIQRLAHEQQLLWNQAKASTNPARCLDALQAVYKRLGTFCDEHGLDPAAHAPPLANEIRILRNGVNWFMENASTLMANGTLVKQGDLFFEDLGYLALHVVEVTPP